MKFDADGKIVYELEDCACCNATGKIEIYGKCPNRLVPRTATYKHPCPICGCKDRTTHKMFNTLKTSETRVCEKCEGTGKTMEDKFSYVTLEMWNALNFRVMRSNRKQSNSEYHLGILTLNDKPYSTVCSITDYGACNKITDEQLIEKVKQGFSSCQAMKIIDGDGYKRDIGILTSDNGYSLVKLSKGG